MKIQIFQHLPTLPKAGIFCPLPILCVAFRAFIPDRSAFRCSPLPCLSMFRPLVPMHKSAHSAAHPAAPPNHACAPHRPPDASAKGQRTHTRRCTAIASPSHTRTPHTPITPHTPTPAPTAPLSHRPLATSIRGSTPPRHHAACRFSQPHTPAKKPPPPHTQASKKDCPAQEQSFL